MFGVRCSMFDVFLAVTDETCRHNPRLLRRRPFGARHGDALQLGDDAGWRALFADATGLVRPRTGDLCGRRLDRLSRSEKIRVAAPRSLGPAADAGARPAYRPQNQWRAAVV